MRHGLLGLLAAGPASGYDTSACGSSSPSCPRPASGSRVVGLRRGRPPARWPEDHWPCAGGRPDSGLRHSHGGGQRPAHHDLHGCARHRGRRPPRAGHRPRHPDSRG